MRAASEQAMYDAHPPAGVGNQQVPGPPSGDGAREEAFWARRTMTLEEREQQRRDNLAAERERNRKIRARMRGVDANGNILWHQDPDVTDHAAQ